MAEGEDLYRAACEASLENASQFVNDARLLMEHRSFGHASALAIFGGEEVAKAYACWMIAEGWIPANSGFAKGVFRWHQAKYQIEANLLLVMWMEQGLENGTLNLLDLMTEGLQVLERPNKLKGFEESMEQMAKAAEERDQLRQESLYIDIDDEGEIVSPSLMTEQEAIEVLSGVEARFSHVKKLAEKKNAQWKDALNTFFASLPEGMWESETMF